MVQGFMFDSPAPPFQAVLFKAQGWYYLCHLSTCSCSHYNHNEFKDNITDSFIDYIRWQDMTMMCFRFLSNLKEMLAASASVPVMGYWLRESEIKHAPVTVSLSLKTWREHAYMDEIQMNEIRESNTLCCKMQVFKERPKSNWRQGSGKWSWMITSSCHVSAWTPACWSGVNFRLIDYDRPDDRVIKKKTVFLCFFVFDLSLSITSL